LFSDLPLVAKISNLALYLLVAGGLYGAMSLSYSTLTDLATCPNIVGIPVCYVVAAGYAVMALGLGINFSVRLTRTDLSSKAFMSGWLVVFVIAGLASLVEISAGNTCPTNDLAIPLCYLSLALCILILILFKLNQAGIWGISD